MSENAQSNIPSNDGEMVQSIQDMSVRLMASICGHGNSAMTEDMYDTRQGQRKKHPLDERQGL